MSDPYFDRLNIFSTYSPEQRAAIQPLLTEVDESDGTILFNQGEPAEYLYIVVEGEILIEYKPEDGPALVIATIKSEGVAGWSSALGNEVYTSSAICAQDCLLLQIRGRDLQEFYQQEPVIGSLLLSSLAEVIAQRMRNTHTQVVGLLEQGLRQKSQPFYQNEPHKL